MFQEERYGKFCVPKKVCSGFVDSRIELSTVTCMVTVLPMLPALIAILSVSSQLHYDQSCYPLSLVVSLELLGKRNIFSNVLMELLDVLEAQGGRVTDDQSEPFIHEALRTFSWQSVAAATFNQYPALKAEHLILADIASFQSAHINHLTPRTLDIPAVQTAMKEAGMAVKSQIERHPLGIVQFCYDKPASLPLKSQLR